MKNELLLPGFLNLSVQSQHLSTWALRIVMKKEKKVGTMKEVRGE